jgi:hypothetical protein
MTANIVVRYFLMIITIIGLTSWTYCLLDQLIWHYMYHMHNEREENQILLYIDGTYPILLVSLWRSGWSLDNTQSDFNTAR